MKIVRVPEKSQTPTRPVPYLTKAGVQIGLMYQPPSTYQPDTDMERLQCALISRRSTIRWDLVAYWSFMALILIVSVIRHYGGAE